MQEMETINILEALNAMDVWLGVLFVYLQLGYVFFQKYSTFED